MNYGIRRKLTDMPLAVAGLISYRYPSIFSGQWIMIGAESHADALNQAKLSLAGDVPELAKLQIWDGKGYVNVERAER